METKPPSTANAIKTAITVCGSVVFLIIGIVVGVRARHCQITGEPMPNGKGGVMSVGDGYLIALVLLLFCVACLLQARRFWREKPV